MSGMSSAQLAILAENVFKSFGTGQRQSVILRDVSLGVARGETVFLVGPSGSGKTTLLSILGCILTPDDGRVRILGQNVGKMSPQQLTAFRRNHLGFIFQSFNLFPTLSALDNIRLTLTMRGASLRAATEQASDLLNQLGLWHRSHLRPGKLSSGECQRVAIARALADNPSVLFADEPTASLDAENGQSVMKLLTHLGRERGVTLVVVTHDNRIFPFADRILHLEDGELTHEWVPGVEGAPAVEEMVATRGLPPGRLRFLKECLR
jgi:putative ABC transport system ATP-binding protein